MDDDQIQALLIKLAENQAALTDILQATRHAPKPSRPPLARDTAGVIFSGMMTPAKQQTQKDITQPKVVWRSGPPGKGGTASVNLYEYVNKLDGKGVRRTYVRHTIGKVTEEEADRRRDALVAAKNSRTLSHPVVVATFQEFLDRYYLPGHVADLSLATRNQYQSLLRLHIVPMLGKLQLRNIDTPMCQAVLETHKTTASLETLKKLKGLMSGVFSLAIRLGVLTANPAQHVRVPRIRRVTTQNRPTPTLEQAARLLRVLDTPQYRPCGELMVLGCTTSFGWAELLGLRWLDLNLTDQDDELPRRSARVQRTYYRGEFGDCKNDLRKRTARLPRQVVSLLLAHRERSLHTAPDDVVFCNESGQPLGEHHTRRLLVAACREAGVPRLGWHAFRRYFATQSKAKNMDDDERRRMLGHASSLMTLHYTSADLDRREAGVEAVCEDLFGEEK